MDRSSKPTRIYAEWMFDGETVVTKGGVLLEIEGSQISRVKIEALPEEGDLCFLGCCVLPGLIDAHVHLCFSAGQSHAEVVQDLMKTEPDILINRALKHAEQAVQAGITTVRDCGGPGYIPFVLREMVRSGRLHGPEILVSGAPITTPKGHLHYIGVHAKSRQEIERRSNELLEAGADFLKLIVTGGNMTPESDRLGCPYEIADIRQAVRCAETAKTYVAAHVLNREGVRRAVQAGVRTLEHCSWRIGVASHEFDPDLAKLMREQGQIASLTMSAPTWRRIVPHLANLDRHLFADLDERFCSERRMLESGVRFVLHTDGGVRQTPVGVSLIYGIRAAEVELGLRPLDCLRAVTSEAAAALGLSDRGRLQRGQRADIVVVAGQPWRDLAALHQLRAVWCGGRQLW